MLDRCQLACCYGFDYPCHAILWSFLFLSASSLSSLYLFPAQGLLPSLAWEFPQAQGFEKPSRSYGKCVKCVSCLRSPWLAPLDSERDPKSWMERCVCSSIYARERPPFRPPSLINVFAPPGETTTCHQMLSQITGCFPSRLVVLFSICTDEQTALQIQNVMRSFSSSEGSLERQQVCLTPKPRLFLLTRSVNYCSLLSLAPLFHWGVWSGRPSPSPVCLYCKLLSCPGASA